MSIWYNPDATDDEIETCVGDYYGCEICINKDKCLSILSDRLELLEKRIKRHERDIVAYCKEEI